MTIQYIGQTSQRQAGEGVVKDNYGLDTATRFQRIRTSDLDSFLSGFNKSSAHPDYSNLYYHTANSTKGGAYTNVTLTYKGLVDGQIPDRKIQTRTSLQSISLTSSKGANTSGTFRLPQATITYVVKDTEPPDTGLWGGDLKNISSVLPDEWFPNRFPGVVRLGFEYDLSKRLQDIQKTEIAFGKYYACREFWQWVVVPIGGS